MKLSRKAGFTRLLTSKGTSMTPRKTMIRGSVLVPAVALLAALVAPPVTADAATATAPDRNCTLRDYKYGGDEHIQRLPGIEETWQGKGDNGKEPPRNGGKTEFNGRILRLMTSQSLDRSSGRIDNSHPGDRVWVDVTHDEGRNWQQCGIRTGKEGKTTTPWYTHSSRDIKKRWMRACMEVDGVAKCATNGNHGGANNDGRLWWSDD